MEEEREQRSPSATHQGREEGALSSSHRVKEVGVLLVVGAVRVAEVDQEVEEELHRVVEVVVVVVALTFLEVEGVEEDPPLYPVAGVAAVEQVLSVPPLPREWSPYDRSRGTCDPRPLTPSPGGRGYARTAP